MNNKRREPNPNYLDCSPEALKRNAWDNLTEFWSEDSREDITKWPLSKVYKALCSLAHYFVNSNKNTPALMMFDSYIFDRLAERWTSHEVGGSIHIANNNINIGSYKVKDPAFKQWLIERNAQKKAKSINQLSNTARIHDHSHK
jgi:hypothetical protein